MKTLVYRYGALPPLTRGDEVAAQMKLGHVYQNKLVEIDRARRTEREAALAKVPEVAAVDGKIRALEADLETARKELSAQRSDARQRDAGDPTHAQNVLAALKPLWAQRKAAIKTALLRPEVIGEMDAIYARRKEAVKAARAANGLYWGTYLVVEAAADQAAKSITPPRFQRWTGDGAVSVQLMGGLSVADMLSCDDTRLRLDMVTSPVPGRAGKPLPTLSLRIGSEGRAPIFAKWPVIVHRTMPQDGILKWAKVVRRMVGPHEQWSVHFTVQVPDQPDASISGDPLAVNLRWAKVVADGEETTLAADWHDGTQSGEIVVAPAVVSQLNKADDLQSIRDKNFEAAKKGLSEAFEALNVPDAHKERLVNLHAWKAQGKLASYVIWWRTNRFDADSDAFMKAEAWRKQDKHLWCWEANSRRKALARRRDDYRVFAATAARRYRVLVIENLRLSGLAAKPKPEEDREQNPRANSQRFATAPSELRGALVHAFRRNGLNVVEVPAGFTSKEMIEHFRVHGGVAVAKPATKSAVSERRMKNKKAGKVKAA